MEETIEEQEKIKKRKGKRWWKILLGILAGGILALGIYTIVVLYPFLNLPAVTKEQLDGLQLDGFDKVMIVAHPDDELLWGGQHLLQDNYLVVCITRGYDEVRRAEFEAVLKETGDKGLILSYPDKIGNKRSSWSLWREAIETDIAEVLSYKEWEQVVSHNEAGEYGHRHHIMTHEIVEREYKETDCKAALFWFGTYYVNDRIPYDLEEMDKTDYNRKREIMKLYESQRGTLRKLYHMMPYEHWISADEAADN